MLVTENDLRKSLKDIAVRYPQYVGKCDGWSVGVATRKYSTKGGLVMIKGDAVLVDWESEDIGTWYGRPRQFVTVWSARRSQAVSVDIRVVKQRYPYGSISNSWKGRVPNTNVGNRQTGKVITAKCGHGVKVFTLANRPEWMTPKGYCRWIEANTNYVCEFCE